MIPPEAIVYRPNVAAILQRENGDIFVAERINIKGAWQVPQGGIDSGEDAETALFRELQEEIGLVVAQPPVRWRRIEACADTGNEFVWVYRCAAEGPFVLHPAEIERGEWFMPDEVTRLIAERPADFSRSFRLVWRRVAKD